MLCYYAGDRANGRIGVEQSASRQVHATQPQPYAQMLLAAGA